MRKPLDNHNSAGMVRSTIRMLIPLSKQSAVLDILRSVQVQIQFEPSCIKSRLYRGADEARAIMVEELWENAESIQRHLNSEMYRQVLLAIEMADETPEIRFDKISSSSGVETIEKARSKTLKR